MRKEFVFAWANSSVAKYTSDHIGLNFWPISVALDLDSALNDPRWASPPTGFFKRPDPPVLHLGVLPFWENVVKNLATECASVDLLHDGESEIENIRALATPVSHIRAVPRLLRATNMGPEEAEASADPPFTRAGVFGEKQPNPD